MVTRRLARSIADLQTIVGTIRAKGAALVCTEQPVDTSTAARKAFLDMLGVFAEFETSLRRERRAEGIAKAKAAGVYKGRAATIDPAKIRQLRAEGMGGAEIAKRLGSAAHPSSEVDSPHAVTIAAYLPDIVPLPYQSAVRREA